MNFGCDFNSDFADSFRYATGGFLKPQWKKPDTYKSKQLTDKYFTPVLRRSDIQLIQKPYKNSVLLNIPDTILITAPDFEEIIVPDYILKKAVQMQHHFYSIRDCIIDLCIKEAVFYAPVEHSQFLI